MIKLLEIKELLISYFKKYEKYIYPIGKFVFALIVLTKLNNFLGYSARLNGFAVNVILSIVAAFIPGSWFVLLLIGVISFQLYASTMLEVTVIVTIFMLILYLLFVRVFPKMSIFVVIIPLMFSFKLAYVVPIIAGIFFGPTAIIAISSGVLVYYFVDALPGLFAITSTTLYETPDTLMSMYKYILDAIIQDKFMLLTIFVFAIVVLVTYIISQFEFDFIWYIAIGAGGLVNILGFLIGSVILTVQVGIGGIILETILALIICAIIQFMRFSLDYQRTEKVQFEDDEYYYYVKAIPKIRISRSERAVKQIK